jgi:hypothetical protein
MIVTQYQMNYPYLDKKFSKDDPRLYALRLIVHVVKELERGFVPVKIYLPNKKGTRIRYAPVSYDNIRYFNTWIAETNKFVGLDIPPIRISV